MKGPPPPPIYFHHTGFDVVIIPFDKNLEDFLTIYFHHTGFDVVIIPFDKNLKRFSYNMISPYRI